MGCMRVWGGEGVHHVCKHGLVCGCIYEGSVCMDECVKIQTCERQYANAYRCVSV